MCSKHASLATMSVARARRLSPVMSAAAKAAVIPWFLPTNQPRMSNCGNKVLDATRTVFIRTHRTRLGSGAVSAAELDSAFQPAFGVSVSGCRRIANGLIIELLNATDKEKCLDLYVVVRGLACASRYMLTLCRRQRSPTAAHKSASGDNKRKESLTTNAQLETAAIPDPQPRAASTTAAPAPIVDPNRVMSDALLALDSQRATPQATAAVLGQFKSLPAFATLLVKSTRSSELVRLLCVDDSDFRDRFANDLLQEFFNELLARPLDFPAVVGTNVADTAAMVGTFATERLATVARLVGSLAGSRVLSDGEALRASCRCVPDNLSLVPTCNILALCVMTEHIAGASATVLVDCVARLERTESFTPPPSVPIAANIRRVCRMHTVARVAPDSPLRPLANLPSSSASAPPPAAPRISATRTPVPRVDPEYARVFGVVLAAAHGNRLRKAALDIPALVALLEFAPRDRVAMFEGLGIPLGQAVQLATALVRNLRTSGAD
jgi:hypothetical protein